MTDPVTPAIERSHIVLRGAGSYEMGSGRSSVVEILLRAGIQGLLICKGKMGWRRFLVMGSLLGMLADGR